MDMSGGEQTISPEFLQNIQSAVNSQGVLGQVQVIETENGPVTVLFMEEGADASGLVGDNLTVTVPDGSTGLSETIIQDGKSEVQYEFVQSGEEYSHIVSEGVTGLSGLDESVVSSVTGNSLNAGETVISTSGSVGTDIGLTGIQSIVDANTDSVNESDLSSVPTVADIPVEQVSAESLQQAGETSDTYYITDSGQILKIDTSALNLGNADTLQLLQGEDDSLQVISQGQTIQITSQGEQAPPQSETQISYINAASGSASTSFGTSPNFEYTATRLDSPLVIDSRVEEPKVLSYKTTNRQRTNIMRQPQKTVSHTIISKPNIITQSKGQTSLLAQSGYKTVKEIDSRGIVREVLYPTSPKQKIIYPKVTQRPSYTTVINKGQSTYQPQQLITTVSRSQNLMKTGATQTGFSRITGNQLTSKQPTTQIIYPGKPVVSPVVGRAPAVKQPPLSKAQAADLLSVAMKQADVVHSAPMAGSVASKPASHVSQLDTNHSESSKNEGTFIKANENNKAIVEPEGSSDIHPELKNIADVAKGTVESQIGGGQDKQQTVDHDKEPAASHSEVPDSLVKTTDVAATHLDENDLGLESMEAEEHAVEKSSTDDKVGTEPDASKEPTSDENAKQKASSSDGGDVETKKSEKNVEPLPSTSAQIKSIDVPDSDVTIQLYADGTLVTKDKSGTNCSQVKLEDLGLDLSMLEGNTDIELLIVQGDGREVRATINTSMHVSPTTESVTKAKTTEPTSSAASGSLGVKTTSSGVSTQTPSKSTSHSTEAAPINEARPYKCSMCPRTFKFYRTYRCHEIVHTKAITFTCHLCQRLFAREVNLQSHLELHKKKGIMRPVEKKAESEDEDKAEEDKFQCAKCEKAFATKNGLNRHVREVHTQDRLACPICAKEFTNEVTLRKHARMHIGPFTCPHCSKLFQNDLQYHEHIKTEHANAMHVCALCELVLPSKSAYSSHIKMRHTHVDDLSPFIKDKECYICNRKFDTQEQVESHMSIHKTDKDHECPACHKKYKQMWKLEQHIRENHENGVTFTCSECEDTFGYKGKLDIHVKLYHRGPYQCYICYEQFPGRLEMERHQFKDHDKALTCSKCKEKFETSLKLKEHLKIHDSRNHMCDSCGAGFEHKPSLKSHLVDKHFGGIKANLLKERPDMANVNFEIICDVCGEYFPSRPLYKQHLRDIHFGGDSVLMLEFFPSLVKVSDPPEPVACDHCGKSFAFVHSLNSHLKSHLKETTVRKPNQAHRDEEELSEDEDEEHVDFTNIEPRDVDKEYKCEKCNAEFSRKAALEKHVLIRHTKDEFKEALKEIEKEEIERAELEEMEGLKETPKPEKKTAAEVPASITPKRGRPKKVKIGFPAPKSIEKKQNNTAFVSSDFQVDESKRKCITCKRVFTLLKNLRKHVRNHHSVRSTVEKVYETSTPSINEDGTLQCTRCEKSYAELVNLRRHMYQKHGVYLQSNAMESPNKSPTKKKKSEDSDEDYEGMDTSSVEGKGSDISSFLGMNFNLGKAHSCNIESVKKKQHRCNLCGAGFSREATLKKHQYLHETGETELKLDLDDVSDLLPAKYPCKSCGNMYSTALGLIHHNRSKHADVDEETVLAEIDEIDEKFKEESPKKKIVDKEPSKSQKRKLLPDADELREVAKKRMKRDKEGKESYECKSCGSIYYTFKGLINHERDIHGFEKPSSPQTVRTSLSGRVIKTSTRLSDMLQCDTCSKTFSEYKKLKLHILRVHGDDTYTRSADRSKLVYNCDVCEQKFSTISYLRHHMLSVHDEEEDASFEDKSESSVCDICKEEFPTAKSLELHKIKHTGEKPYNCCLCNKRFVSKFLLECHMKKLHAKLWAKKVKCKICLMLFENDTAMLKHKNVHKKPVPEENSSYHKCNVCSKVFKWKRNLTSHIETHHEDVDPLTCGVCNKVFPDKDSIKKHMIVHSSKQDKFACDKCDKSFPKEVSLKMHISHMHKSTPGPLSCDICKESFTVKLKLMEHMLTHTSVMPYKCTMCSASFKQEFRLQAHMLNHKVSKTKTETENQEENVGDSALKNEKQTSQGKFKCSKCNKKFKHMWMIRTHAAQVHKPTKKLAPPAPSKAKTRSRSTSVSTTASTSESKELKKKSSDHASKKAAEKERGKGTYTKGSSVTKSPKVSSAIKTPKSTSKDAKGSSSNFCKKCKKNFLKYDTYKLHMQVVHGEKKESQDGREKKNEGSSKKRTIITTLKAKQLQKEKSAKTETKKSEKSSKEQSSNKCPICKKTFEKGTGLKIHLKNKHKVRVAVSPSKSEGQRRKCLYCKDCSRIFWSQAQFDNHNKKHHPDKAAKDLDRQVMEALKEVKTEPADTATSPKAADFETIKHKCEFCAQVHYTKKLFDQHILKEHPEHAAEYGISSDKQEKFKRRSEKDIISLGKYDKPVLKQLSASPVVSLQRIQGSKNTASENGETEDSYELEFQKFLESEQLSDISEDVPEDLTEDSNDEADSNQDKVKKATKKKLDTGENDDLIMETDEITEDATDEENKNEQRAVAEQNSGDLNMQDSGEFIEGHAADQSDRKELDNKGVKQKVYVESYKKMDAESERKVRTSKNNTDNTDKGIDNLLDIKETGSLKDAMLLEVNSVESRSRTSEEQGETSCIDKIGDDVVAEDSKESIVSEDIGENIEEESTSKFLSDPEVDVSKGDDDVEPLDLNEPVYFQESSGVTPENELASDNSVNVFSSEGDKIASDNDTSAFQDTTETESIDLNLVAENENDVYSELNNWEQIKGNVESSSSQVIEGNTDMTADVGTSGDVYYEEMDES